MTTPQDPKILKLLAELHQADRQTLADCVEADDPHKAAALRRGYDITWVQADGFYIRHFDDKVEVDRFAAKLRREDRAFEITVGKDAS